MQKQVKGNDCDNHFLKKGEACVCRRGYANAPDGSAVPCISCMDDNMVPSEDRSQCMSCGSSTSGMEADGSDCVCPDNTYIGLL